MPWCLVDKFVDLPFVPVKHGVRRWIQIGPLPQFQPSELCKIAYVLALAWYLRYYSNYRKFTGLIGPFILTLLPMALIVFEPDLGTVVLMMPILFAMLFVAGARSRHLLIIILLAIFASPLLWHFMEPYQRSRISSVLLQSNWIRQKTLKYPMLCRILAGNRNNIETWEKNDGYQLTHSKFAIASGGAGGTGFRKGPYVKYSFLPDRHNDFIFALIGHQWGFRGCAAVLLLYVIIVACGLEIAVANTEPFARLLAVGLVAMFAVEVIVNVSMAIGLMPITGLTLPFVSYGGSSLLVSFLGIGLLNNIGRYRPFTIAAKSFAK